MADNSPESIPADQAKALVRAYTAFTSAADPADPWANRRLASVINAATAAGWSRRTTASALGISRERALKISQFTPSLKCEVPRYRSGESFPASAISKFRSLEEQIRNRREQTRSDAAALIRAAHNAGWPFQVLGEIVGASGEWIRQLNESAVPADTAPGFPVYRRPTKGRPPLNPRGTLSDEERRTMRKLAARARSAAKVPVRLAGQDPREETRRRVKAVMEARQASEQLSAMIIGAKARRVRWEELDEACGYKPGAARARAVRHGYGKLPPSMNGYAAARGE
ncbi:hypothetical protein [Arthrobacter sp. IK3]|uniref:hypothetical protein n=1 Tax=Arthrobacter sp. IK3 TaxID=3448169 RepID=UPI003EE33FAB